MRPREAAGPWLAISSRRSPRFETNRAITQAEVPKWVYRYRSVCRDEAPLYAPAYMSVIAKPRLSTAGLMRHPGQ